MRAGGQAAMPRPRPGVAFPVRPALRAVRFSGVATSSPTMPTTPMTHRERSLAVLRYQPYDRLPVVHFGFWRETLLAWAAEGRIPGSLAHAWGDGNVADAEVSALLGFDGNWSTCAGGDCHLRPPFAREVVRELPDGSREVRNGDGVVVLEMPGAGSIPAEVRHLLEDRASWEAHYKSRLAWSPGRATGGWVRAGAEMLRFDEGGFAWVESGRRDWLLGLWCGSLYGNFRNLVGVEGSSYLLVDDEPLFDEILAAYGELCFRNVEAILAHTANFDFGHFWEDICFKSGPLVNPRVFAEKVGPHYRRITELLARHGIDLVSVDCDGKLDELVPIWLENGVNVMFPIEVGTWNASLEPWRARYGRAIRGVGGMNKVVFSRDRAAVDAEVARLRRLVDLGGFIPCPDHRIAPDAQWDLVTYYTRRMRETFG